jgi:uncharacterized membrane protein
MGHAVDQTGSTLVAYETCVVVMMMLMMMMMMIVVIIIIIIITSIIAHQYHNEREGVR